MTDQIIRYRIFRKPENNLIAFRYEKESAAKLVDYLNTVDTKNEYGFSIDSD